MCLEEGVLADALRFSPFDPTSPKATCTGLMLYLTVKSRFITFTELTYIQCSVLCSNHFF